MFLSEPDGPMQEWKKGPLDPDDDVLLELGRMTYRTMSLEPIAHAVCRAVKKYDGKKEGGPIGPRIKRALTDAEDLSDEDLRTRTTAWLVRASAALARRNTVLHGQPGSVVRFERRPGPMAVRVMRPGRAVAPDPLWEGRLDSVVQHDNPKSPQPASVIPFTHEGIRSVRMELEEAFQGWREVVPGMAEFGPRKYEQ